MSSSDFRLKPSKDLNPDLFPEGTISEDGEYVVVFTSQRDRYRWASVKETGGTSSSAATIIDPNTGKALAPDKTGAITLPNYDELILGTGAPTGNPPSGKEVYIDSGTGRYYLAVNDAWSNGFGGSGALKTRITQALVVGNNTITHNFNLPSPFISIVSVRDTTTGQLIDHTVNSEAANTLRINVGAAVASAQITILA